MSDRAVRILGLVSALVGLAASVAAATVHYRLLSSPYHASFCDVSASVSCTQVYLSPVGSIRGVPVSVLGGLWFAFVGIVEAAGLVAPRTTGRNVASYVLLLSLPAALFVAFLAFISLAVLKVACLLCIATYVAFVGVLVSTLAGHPFPLTHILRRARVDLTALASTRAGATVLLLFLVSSAIAIVVFARESRANDETSAAPLTDQQRTDFERWLERQPRYPDLLPADGASVLILKFNDYQCPPCARSFFDYEDVLERYRQTRSGFVTYQVKDYPLDAECNSNLADAGRHPSACEAAAAVRLARERNRGDALGRWLYQNQESLTPQLVAQAAREVGGVDDFEVKYRDTLEEVRKDVALGKRLDVRLTPTFFVNGRKIEGRVPPRYFEAAIDYEGRRH